MLIYNVKINSGLLLRLVIILLSIFMLCVFGISIYRIFNGQGEFKILDKIKQEDIIKIEPNNYANILQAVHDNPSSYIGIKINFTGYIYRVFDFNSNQFVLARDMYINNEKTQTVVVGFLCEYKNARELEDNKWVDVVGEIKMGKYHNDEVPILQIIDVKDSEKPEEIFIDSPDNTYIPTNGML